MRIAIVGTGSVGGFFGGRLARAGNDVHFVARGRQLEALRSAGLRVESIHGDFELPEVNATSDLEAIGPVELAIVTVKAWHVPEIAETIRPLVADDTTILPLQNGVEAADQLGAVHGSARVVGGLAKIISMVPEPGVIRHLGVEPTIAIGELGGERTERVASIAEVLRRSGVTVELPASIRVAIWEKFLFICAVSGVGAVTRAPVGVVRSMAGARRMLEQAMHEIRAVGVALGVAIPDDAVARTLAFVDGLPPDGTASMQRDLMEGRPSELESQNGAVVRLGEAAGVETPLNAFLYHSLLPMEEQARRSGSDGGR